MRVAVCQFTSGADLRANAAAVAAQVSQAAEGGARLAVFPEASMCSFAGDIVAAAERLPWWESQLSEVARRDDVTVIAGGFTPAPGGKVRNTLLAVSPDGAVERYDKIHLFDAFGYHESAAVAPGDRVVTVDVDGFRLGLATCYDVRFPELFIELAARGADAVAVCASWGDGPGKVDQWELLTRARALDSTSWILASGQADPAASGLPVTRDPLGVGHSRVVDPRGQVVASLGREPGVLVTDLDPGTLTDARAGIPVLANRRLPL